MQLIYEYSYVHIHIFQYMIVIGEIQICFKTYMVPVHPSCTFPEYRQRLKSSQTVTI